MGSNKDKKGKKLDPIKEQRKAITKALKQNKQASKALRKATKDDDKNASDNDDDIDNLSLADIDAILASHKSTLAITSAVTTTPLLTPPSPRANCTITTIGDSGGPKDTLCIFGGEYFDGSINACNNELLLYNTKTGLYKRVESTPSPPPRCSHTAVPFNGKLYVFGGELATTDQFHHYNDMWCLDLKTFKWELLSSRGATPSSRSGHRTVLLRNLLILFGGFYESQTDTRWFNDLWIYNIPNNKWTNVPFSRLAQTPDARRYVYHRVAPIHSSEHTASDTL